MPGRRFSDSQRNEMAERYEAGESFAAIARSLSCSPTTVYGACASLGAEAPNPRPLTDTALGPMVILRGGRPVHRYSPAEDERLFGLDAQGKSINEIAKAMGRRPNSVRGRLLSLARREARAEAV